MHRIFRAFLILGLLTFATACQGQRSPSDQEIRQAVLQQIQGYALESLNHEVFPGTEGRGRIAYLGFIRQERTRYRATESIEYLYRNDIIARGASPQFVEYYIDEAGLDQVRVAQPVSNVGDMYRIEGDLTYRQTANGFDISGSVRLPWFQGEARPGTRIPGPGYLLARDAPAMLSDMEDRINGHTATLPGWSRRETPSSDYYRPMTCSGTRSSV